MRPTSSPSRAIAATAVALPATFLLLAPPALAGGPPPPSSSSATYTNPVSDDFADTFADPAVLRGKDGWWYAYGTTDPLREGEGTRHLLPISRSDDLVDWEYVGDAFTEDSRPDWADRDRGAALWAPDIRYVDGEYRLYYVVTETTRTDEPNDNAIGVATAPTPVGPWTDSGAPVVEPRRGGAGEPGNFLWTFDPSHVTAPDGSEHLVYGSYYGGIWVTELSEDGTRAVGTPTQIAIDNKYEGAYVVHRDGYWYLFASSANCCAGPTTGYSVHVGRSESLTGPYVDREGVPLLQSRAGGTPVIAPNGNAFVGTGHNAVVTDLSGQDWNVYHAIDRADPYLDGTDGINERPMLLDRLDWVDGWPTTRAGLWASDDEQPGPVTGPVHDFERGLDRRALDGRGWRTATDDDAGRHVTSTRAADLLTRAPVSGDLRVEADLRSDGAAYGLATGDHPAGVRVAATVDPDAGTLTVRATTRERGRTVTLGEAAAPLPADFDAGTWKAVALELRDGTASAEVSHARLGDPLAHVTLELADQRRGKGGGGHGPGAGHGRAGAFADGRHVDVDNLSVLRASTPVTDVVEPPAPGATVWEDEFDGSALDPAWTTLRDPEVTVADGVLSWPTEAADLVGAGNDAGVLLRDVPDGDWAAETRLTIDLGVDEIRNFQQAGIVAYVDDDRFARLSHVAIWNTRQTEFGYEIPYADRLQYGGTIVGPPAETTWLRLTKTSDDAGEQEVRASTSTDGETWVHGGVWTFPADAEIRLGLVSHGGAGSTAQFGHVRVSELG